MARDEMVTLPKNVWTQLTNANASAICVQNNATFSVQLQGTNGPTAPTGIGGASKTLLGGQTLAADLTLAQLWPGVSGVNRVWALSWLDTTVSVSHADA